MTRVRFRPRNLRRGRLVQDQHHGNTFTQYKNYMVAIRNLPKYSSGSWWPSDSVAFVKRVQLSISLPLTPGYGKLFLNQFYSVSINVNPLSIASYRQMPDVQHYIRVMWSKTKAPKLAKSSLWQRVDSRDVSFGNFRLANLGHYQLSW